MRLIDADALHDALRAKQKWIVKRENMVNEGYTYDQVHFAIDDMPTVDAVPQWIPCSERLPSSEEDVLCDDEGRVTIGYYTNEEIGWHDMHSYRIYPNAWMPLPTPYERKED